MRERISDEHHHQIHHRFRQAGSPMSCQLAELTRALHHQVIQVPAKRALDELIGCAERPEDATSALPALGVQVSPASLDVSRGTDELAKEGVGRRPDGWREGRALGTARARASRLLPGRPGGSEVTPSHPAPVEDTDIDLVGGRGTGGEHNPRTPRFWWYAPGEPEVQFRFEHGDDARLRDGKVIHDELEVEV